LRTTVRNSYNTDPPLVSVILPTFNRLEYVRAAVRSVLRQTHPDWALVIADDGSSDDVRAYLRELGDPRITVLWLPHSGNPSIVRNAAIRSARGTYLAFLDSDDLWEPTKLEVQLRALRASPDRRWSYTAVAQIDPDGRPISNPKLAPWIPYDGSIVEPLLKIEALLATPAVMAERSLVEEAGGFDEGQLFGEDYDLWLRLAMRSEVTVVTERLALVRTGGLNYGANRIGAYEGWVRLYGKMAACLPDARLRAIARRKRADNSLIVAGFHVAAGNTATVWKTLLGAARYGWRYPRWWVGAARATMRAALPARRQTR
jgi:glycosyltransferase involved in cell wall biosynthesis